MTGVFRWRVRERGSGISTRCGKKEEERGVETCR
jgi:hypothetical protein